VSHAPSSVSHHVACPLAAAALLAMAVLGAGCLTLNPAQGTRANGDALTTPRPGQYLQGRTPVDAEDFYAIAGDKDAVRRVRNHRAALVGTQMAWLSVGAVSIPATLAAGGDLAAGIVVMDDNRGAGIGLVIGSALLMTAGIVGIPLGFALAAQAGNEMWRPVLPHGRAQDAAERYNSGDEQRKRRR
jgi:hypothetical protein